MTDQVRPSRRRRRVVALLGVVAVAWLGAAAFSAVSAVRDVRAGQRLLERARTTETPSELFEGDLARDLRSAHRSLSRASTWLRGPLLAPVRYLPVAGRQLRSLTKLSGAAALISDVGADGVSRARELAARTGEGPERVETLRQVAGLAISSARRLRDLDLGPRHALFGPLARGRNRIAGELEQLRTSLQTGATGAHAIAEWFAGPRRYLVFAANNAEMRAGSGMFLSVGELAIQDGRLSLGSFRPVTEIPLPPGAVPLDGDLANRWGWLAPNQEWRNLMLSPRFDASAALASRMWTALGNQPVDGVLALDPVALSQLMRVTGPVEVDNRRIGADTVVAELLHDQYQRFSTEQRPERQEALGRVAGAVVARLEGGGWSISGLADALVVAARGRHVLAWSARPSEQAGWEAAGVAGQLRDDSLLVSVLNRGGNKLDQHLRVEADLDVQRSPAGSEASLRLVLHNAVPEGEPPYVTGPLPGTDFRPGEYIGIVTVNLPARALNGRIEGVEHLALVGADGPTRVVGTQVRIQPGERRELTVRFRLPSYLEAVRVEPSARVPAIMWSAGPKRWADGAPYTVRW